MFKVNKLGAHSFFAYKDEQTALNSFHWSLLHSLMSQLNWIILCNIFNIVLAPPIRLFGGVHKLIQVYNVLT